MNTIRTRLYTALTLRHMTPAELARASGLNKSTVSRYLSGKVEPKQSAVYAMAKALGVAPAWLFGEDVPITNNAQIIPDIVIEVNGKPVIIEVKKLTPEQQVKFASFYNYLLTEQGGADNADSDI